MAKSKNKFSVRDNTIYIENSNWNKVGMAEYREDYYEELTSVTWSKSGEGLYSSKFKCYLHQYIMEKWYGKEHLKEMYENGYIIEHFDNNEFNNKISNLDFLLKDYNTAKGQSLDKDIEKYRDKIALRMYKNFKKGTYEISVGFNEDFFEIKNGTYKPIKSLHFLYDKEYRSVILDAYLIIDQYISSNAIELKKLSFKKYTIEYATTIQLTPEEVESVGNGKGGFIERDGKFYVITGKNVKLIASHQIKDWE